MAKVLLTREAAGELDDLPLVIHSRVLALLERLANWPEVSGAKPLAGSLAGHWRLRSSDLDIGAASRDKQGEQEQAEGYAAAKLHASSPERSPRHDP